MKAKSFHWKVGYKDKPKKTRTVWLNNNNNKMAFNYQTNLLANKFSFI